MFKLCGTLQRVHLDTAVFWFKRLGVKQIKLKLGANIDFIAHSGGALYLCHQRLTRVNGYRLVVHALGATHRKCNAGFPWHRNRFCDRKHMHVRVAIVEVHIRCIPDITGHIDSIGCNRQRIAVLANRVPVTCRYALTTHNTIEITDTQRDCVCTFR